jgi:uncharacterized protein YfaS (alpha-2-macroglobulin family)
MKRASAFVSILSFIFFHFGFAHAGDNAFIEVFSPQGTVKQIRQVSVRFSEQIMPFGDPRLVEPFEIRCPEKGKGRWADDKEWVYDFDNNLPAGVICEFTVKHDLNTLSGKPITGQQQFSFSTGGPSIVESIPKDGSDQIDEDQIFILRLDAEAAEESVVDNVSCAIEGINERVGVNIIKGEEREKIAKQYKNLMDPAGILVQCKQDFPAKAMVKIIWGKGVSSPSGVRTTDDQTLSFKVREPFIAKFKCQRENAKSDCIPVLPMWVDFSAPVAWDVASKIILKSGHKAYSPEKPSHGGEEGEGESEGTPVGGNENFVYSVSFKGPFPENTAFELSVPAEFKDDGGRDLFNKDSFPLTVRTSEDPPLAKFSARFGIIELNGDATLPVTLRNLEPRVKAKMVDLDESKPGDVEKGQEMVAGLKGRLHKISLGREEKVIEWLKRVASAEREHPLLKKEQDVREFSVPKPGGAKAFEVVGIPLKNPGFYVVEMESLILGTSLLDKQKPMFVPTAALVTNLAAHFKWGRESSLVWVTTLDKSEPVKEASVTVRDCNGKALWKGKTDEGGIARINKQLPSGKDLPHCSTKINYSEASHALEAIGDGLFIFAKTSQDMTFVHSTWSEGIEPWRYNLPAAEYNGPVIAHTIFDRSLLRAGETVHMKHVVRKHTTSGFSLMKVAALPKTVLIQHVGSEQRYEMPLKWDEKGIAETDWNIPRDAKLGNYVVTLVKREISGSRAQTSVGGHEEGDEENYSPDGWESGSFRVEEFRVPQMKAVIQPPKEPLINAREMDVDLFVTYLSGGGAGDARVKLRGQVQPRYVHFDDYEDFAFANGEVREEITRRSGYEEEQEQLKTKASKLLTSEFTLDKNGSLRAKIPKLPPALQPLDILTELEFMDPSGEIQTVSQKIPLWPSGILVGVKPDSWSSSKDNLKLHVVVLDLKGNPVQGKEVKVTLFRKKSLSHRKRLVGGFYSYENVTEVKKVGSLCEGKTDARGLFICEAKSPVSGSTLIQASAVDNSGNSSFAHQEVWIVGENEWWFEVSDHDRIDLIPEKKRYEPGDTAKLQVRMPFRHATALITVEREGIIDAYVRKLSGKTPYVEIPVKGNYAPNIFISALVVRGRVSGIQPDALVDLGKPSFKLGIAEINVGWSAHELKVNVSSERSVYKVREKVKIKVKVRRVNGALPPGRSEVTIAAVDEGLLELMPNKSWKLLEAMMGRRGYEVNTATAQMQVVGKRHYGLKAQPHGGGGGKQPTRELFDTLLLWKARVTLDARGEANVEIPLNDSLTSFRIVAVAQGGTGLFGTGQMSIQTTQDLMVFPGLPKVVREGDNFRAGFVIRNASNRKMDVDVMAVMHGARKRGLEGITESLAAGESKEVGWDIEVPSGIDTLKYEVTAKEKTGAASDSIKVQQKVTEAVPVRTFQATLAQVDTSFAIDVEKPHDALSGRGGINVSLRPKISNSLGGVLWYMKRYPYSCMEQRVSQAVALRDEVRWKSIVAELPAYLDSDGLVKYFPVMTEGSDVLTSYIASITEEAGWAIPDDLRGKMESGLKGFIEGKIVRYSSLPTADLSIRKMAALEALARRGVAETGLLGSITIEPNLWPTSVVIDWMSVLLRMKDIPDRDRKLKETEQILRSRMNFQGTTVGFSTEAKDRLWWLMTSPDVNAMKSILTLLHFDSWNQDMARLVRGALGRQYKGVWDLTTANAWGVLAMEKFSKKFETIPVSGETSSALNGEKRTIEWTKVPEGKNMMFAWPKSKEKLTIGHKGEGKPWAAVQSLAAIPLKAPFSSGYKIKKMLIPVERKQEGKWTKGDVVRVKLEIDAQADMTWVVVTDPVPAGANILGTGLGRDSQILMSGEKEENYIWPTFKELSFEAFRAYYDFMPKGKWSLEYTVRLNNSGTFHLPTTRVEALYSPEMLGEIPNNKFEVGL